MSKTRLMVISTSGKIDEIGCSFLRTYIASKAFEFKAKYDCTPVAFGTKEAIGKMRPIFFRELQDDSDVVIDGLRYVACEGIELTHGRIELDNDILVLANL